MNPQQIERIARDIFDANLQRKRFEPLRGPDLPDSLDDAYRIQSAVYGLFGQQPGAGVLAGHKIALTSRALQEMVGIEQPVYGAMFDSAIFKSPKSLSLADYLRLGLEFEVAARIGRDLPTGKSDWTRDSIADYVDAIMPAFELIEDRNADYGELDAMSVLSDRCWCAGCVLGEPVTDWRSLDLSQCKVQSLFNGQVLDSGVTGDSMGHPFNGLAWVANHVASTGIGLKAGEVIITGSALKTQFPKAGDHVTYQVDGLGEVTVNISA